VSQHSNVIAIVVGVCLSLLLFVFVAVAACVCYRRRQVAKGAPLRFPNPTFGLPGALKGSADLVCPFFVLFCFLSSTPTYVQKHGYLFYSGSLASGLLVVHTGSQIITS
jgi:hypothetical protein